MNNLAFIDHSFHQKSTATKFLIDLLKKKYIVDIYWDESWMKKPGIDLSSLSRKKYDTIIFFQLINYTIRELKATGCKNIILIPMYDTSHWFFDRQWLEYRSIKFLNFSQALHDRLKKFGLNTMHVQYFPSPNNFHDNTGFDLLKGFFWQRTSQITWQHIRKLIEKAKFTQFHIHGAVDPPGFPLILPTEEEKIKYNITISEWFKNRENYFSVASAANVYFAPRLYEGIGMSFLEAMAMGKCVVAPNNPTMNEYINHGVTGYLYDPNNPRPIDFSNASQVAENALVYIEKGYKSWATKRAEIFDFIQAPSDIYKVPMIYYYRRALAELQYRPQKERIKGKIAKTFPALTNKFVQLKKQLRNISNNYC
jgi:glycosyltransferase involved in cell wall biosynthesis